MSKSIAAVAVIAGLALVHPAQAQPKAKKVSAPNAVARIVTEAKLACLERALGMEGTAEFNYNGMYVSNFSLTSPSATPGAPRERIHIGTIKPPTHDWMFSLSSRQTGTGSPLKIRGIFVVGEDGTRADSFYLEQGGKDLERNSELSEPSRAKLRTLAKVAADCRLVEKPRAFGF